MGGGRRTGASFGLRRENSIAVAEPALRRCCSYLADRGLKAGSMLTELISEIAVKILDRTSYAGAAGLMALESMIAPVPSEAVMPFVGFQVADGKWNLWLAIFSTSLGSITGSL